MLAAMSSDWLTIAWLVLGLVLMASELVLPSLVTLFIGASALIVAAVRALGLIDGIPASVALWIASSVFMVLTLRKALARYFPSSSTRGNVDERSGEYGVEVDVLEDIEEGHQRGRIRFQGTSWSATTTTGAIKKGQRARIVFRDNLVYVVEAAEAAEPAQLEARTEQAVPHTVDADKAR